jgi:teichuronic acid biosynthesis glycosyltransferase TuaC
MLSWSIRFDRAGSVSPLMRERVDPVRILMVSGVFPNVEMPELGTFCLERARAMRVRADVRVVAAVPYFPRTPFLRLPGEWSRWSRIPQREQIEGLDVLHPRRLVLPKVGGISTGWFYSRTLDKTIREIYEIDPFDVIDAHFIWPDGYAVSRVAQDLGVPLCITAHGTDLNLMPSFPAIRAKIRETISRADKIIAVCRALGDVAIELGARADRLRVIPNGVDTSRFYPIDRIEARRGIGFHDYGPLFLAIGALIPRKGHEYLIEALALLRAAGSRAKLAIIGEGPSRQKLSKLINSRGLNSSVHLVGSIPHGELYRWLSASDATCLASSREGWPTVFFESWACGTPVIATAVHGAPEAICSPRYGILVGRQDPGLLAAAMREVLVSDWDKGAMRAYAARNTWDLRAQEILGELKELIA